MSTSSGHKLPPDAGALSGERCQLNRRVNRALVELCSRPRPIELHEQTIVVELNVIGAVFDLLVPKLAKISFDSALSIFNRNVKAYRPTERARGSAEPPRASRIPELVVE